MNVHVADLHTCKGRQPLAGSGDWQDGYNVHLQCHIDYFNYVFEVGLKRVVRIPPQVNKQETSCECKQNSYAKDTYFSSLLC